MSVVSLKQRHSWDEFEFRLRAVGLAGDPSVKPYAQAKFSSVLLDPDEVWPISKYVLKKNIAMQRQLHQAFQDEHQIDIFDLNGGEPTVSFTVSGEEGEWLMSPPIVEVSAADNGQYVLLDGEHRFYYGRQLGKPIRVVLVEGVPEHLPVVALPIDWSDVTEYQEVPPVTEKRVFRFPDLDSFPDVSSFSKTKLDEQSFRYFFYRDISQVSSSGIRVSS